jgi:hypothetical protein
MSNLGKQLGTIVIKPQRIETLQLPPVPGGIEVAPEPVLAARS